MLVIALQPTNNNSSFSVGEEFRTVGEVLDDPEGQEPRDDRRQTFQKENPRPARFAAEPVHFRDCDLLGYQIKI